MCSYRLCWLQNYPFLNLATVFDCERQEELPEMSYEQSIVHLIVALVFAI